MSSEDFEAIRELAKKHHDERVAKTPQRIEYAIQQFKKNNINFILKNSTTGHFHCFDKFDNLFQFWCSTGKIYYDNKVAKERNFKSNVKYLRGVHNLIKLLVGGPNE